MSQMFNFDLLPDELQEIVLERFPITIKLINRIISKKWNNLLKKSLKNSIVIGTRQEVTDCVIEKPDCSNFEHERREVLNCLFGKPDLTIINNLLVDYSIRPTAIYIYSVKFGCSSIKNFLEELIENQKQLEHLEIAFCSTINDLDNLPKIDLVNLKHFSFFKNDIKLMPIVINVINNNLQINELCLGKNSFGKISQINFAQLNLIKFEVIGKTNTICPFIKLQTMLIECKQLKNLVLRDEYDINTSHCSTLAFNFTILREFNTSITNLVTASFGSIEKLKNLQKITLLSRNVMVGALSEIQYVSMLDSIVDNKLKILRIGYGFRCLNEAINAISGDQFENLEEIGFLTQDGVYDLPIEHRSSGHIWQVDRELLQLISFKQLRKLEANFNWISDETIKELVENCEKLEILICCFCPFVTTKVLNIVSSWAVKKSPKIVRFGFEAGKFENSDLVEHSSRNSNLKLHEIQMKIPKLCQNSSCKYYNY